MPNSDPWTFRLSVLKGAAYWFVPVWIILVANTVVWIHLDYESWLAIGYYPGLLLIVLTGEPYKLMTPWNLCIPSCIFYTLIAILVSYLVKVRRRRRKKSAPNRT